MSFDKYFLTYKSVSCQKENMFLISLTEEQANFLYIHGSRIARSSSNVSHFR